MKHTKMIISVLLGMLILSGTAISQTLLFFDGFDDGNFTSNPSWFVSGGNWDAVTNVLIQSDQDSYGKAIFSQISSTLDPTVQVDFQYQSPIGIGMRASYVFIGGMDVNNSLFGYIFGLRQGDGGTGPNVEQWEIFDFNGWGQKSPIQTGSSPQEESTPYIIKLSINNGILSAFVDNNQVYIGSTTGTGLEVFSIIGLLTAGEIASFDNISVYGHPYQTLQQTTLITNDITVTSINDKLSATLISGGSTLSGKLLSFSINGTPIGTSLTDINGIAQISIPAGYYQGPYTYTVNFAGDTQYLASTSNSTLTISNSYRYEEIKMEIAGYVLSGDISNGGIANSLGAKIDSAQASFNNGNVNTSTNVLNALVNQLSALSGIGVSNTASTTLTNKVIYLINSL